MYTFVFVCKEIYINEHFFKYNDKYLVNTYIPTSPDVILWKCILSMDILYSCVCFSNFNNFQQIIMIYRLDIFFLIGKQNVVK